MVQGISSLSFWLRLADLSTTDDAIVPIMSFEQSNNIRGGVFLEYRESKTYNFPRGNGTNTSINFVEGHYLMFKLTEGENGPASTPNYYAKYWYKLNAEHLDPVNWNNIIFAIASMNTSNENSLRKAGLWINGLYVPRWAQPFYFDKNKTNGKQMHGLCLQYIGGKGLQDGTDGYKDCFNGQIDGITIWQGGGTGEGGYNTIMTDEIARALYKNGAGHNPLWADSYGDDEYPATHIVGGYLQFHDSMGESFLCPSANIPFGAPSWKTNPDNYQYWPESNQQDNANGVRVETGWYDEDILAAPQNSYWRGDVKYDAASGIYLYSWGGDQRPTRMSECIESHDLVDDAPQYGMTAGDDSPDVGNPSASSLNFNDDNDGHHDDWYKAPVDLNTSAVGDFSSIVVGTDPPSYYVSGPDGMVYHSTSAVDNVSFSFWLSGNEMPSAGDTIFSLNTVMSNSNDGIGAILTGSNPPKIRFFINKSQTSSWYAQAELKKNEWNHVILTYDRYGGSDNMKIFRDGVLSATNTLDEGISNTDAYLVVGKGGSADDYYFSGIMSEFAIFGETLNASAASGIYNDGAPNNLLLEQSYGGEYPGPPSLRMWHRLGGGRYKNNYDFIGPLYTSSLGPLGGRAVFDESPMGNHGLLMGSKWDTSAGIQESSTSEYPVATLDEADWGPK